MDQWSKWFVLMHLLPGDTFECLPFFNIHLAFNTGASYGFLQDASGWQATFFSLIAIISSIVLIMWLRKLPYRDYVQCIGLSLVLGGAVGNLIDRLRLSYVVDFFDVHINNWHFATFNIADAAISVGVVFILTALIRVNKIQ